MSQLRFSPSSENVLAAVTGGSYVALWELNLHEQGVSKVRKKYCEFENFCCKSIVIVNGSYKN